MLKSFGVSELESVLRSMEVRLTRAAEVFNDCSCFAWADRRLYVNDICSVVDDVQLLTRLVHNCDLLLTLDTDDRFQMPLFTTAKRLEDHHAVS
jgi:hypothetical protein